MRCPKVRNRTIGFRRLGPGQIGPVI